MIGKVSRAEPARVVLEAADMIGYRSAEIRRLSRELRQGIRHLHRERIARKHEKLAEALVEKLDRIYVLMTDNEYDASHLQIFLTSAPAQNPAGLRETGSREIHYIQ